jgi:hypothetical protein
LARLFFVLPCDTTLYNRFHVQLDEIKNSLLGPEHIVEQVDIFMRVSGVQPKDLVSVAVDAMAMTPERSSVGAKSSDYMFVIYAQPLDRRSKCFPVHVVQNPSGEAKKVVQNAVDAVCAALVTRGIVPKSVCSDGDACFNARHHAFFKKWYLAFLQNGDCGLEAALQIARRETKIPVGDFLHMWKNFCNKVKNHPVTLCPESTDDLITCEDLRSMLDLGSVLTDVTSIGKMRDSYALQLFSWLNCVKCVQNGNTAATMCLLPWTLQEEVIRSPALTRENRLKKAILNFDLLTHFSVWLFFRALMV